MLLTVGWAQIHRHWFSHRLPDKLVLADCLVNISPTSCKPVLPIDTFPRCLMYIICIHITWLPYTNICIHRYINYGPISGSLCTED